MIKIIFDEHLTFRQYKTFPTRLFTRHSKHSYLTHGLNLLDYQEGKLGSLHPRTTDPAYVKHHHSSL